MLHFILAASLALQLDRALAAFPAERPKLESRLGASQTVDLGLRLVTDRGYVDQAAPEWYTRQAWSQTLQNVATLDIAAVAAAAKETAPELPAEPGLHEGFVRSAIDGLWEPVAVYVPAHHRAHPPIAIVLHGRPQSETELLGQPYFRQLADSTGTVLVAPWGRGDYDFEGTAGRDLNDLAAIAERRYHGDPRALYLVGYSMGGFSVFKVGTQRPWSAVMCISGALLNSEVPSVRFAWRDTPVYVVNGSRDEEIPPVYGLRSAVFLSSLGVPASFYQQPEGSHHVGSLMPALERAWTDMHAGVVRADSIPHAGASAALLPALPAMHDGDLKP